MIVEGALEPRGLVPADPGGAGHQEIPTAAHPQSPQPRDTERHRSAHLCRPVTTPASPPRHACNWTHGKIGPQSPFSLNSFSFGFGGGFPKSLMSRGLIWILFLLDADSHCDKRRGSTFCMTEQNMADQVDISHIPRAPWEPGWEVILVTRFWLISLKLKSFCFVYHWKNMAESVILVTEKLGF